MGKLNLDAMRKKINQLETSNTRTTSLWKPQSGVTEIRILPYKYNKENPFIELMFHYDIGGKTYLSPISFGRPDPIEEFADKLKTVGDRDSYQLARKLQAKMRVFAPIAVRGEENQGSFFWGFGKTVYKELLSIMVDPDYGDITDVTTGRDVKVEFRTAEELNANFPSTSIRPKPNQTPISDNKAVVDKLVNEQKDIREVYQELSYDDLKEVLNNYLNPEDEEEEEKQDEIKSEISSTSANVDDFEDIFNR